MCGPHRGCKAIAIAQIGIETLRDKIGDDLRVRELSGEMDRSAAYTLK